MYILPFTFFGSLLRSCDVSSITFCIDKKAFYLLYPFWYLAAQDKKAILIAVYIYQFLTSTIASLRLL